MTFLRVLWAESLKMKRTLALWMVPIGPSLVVLLQIVVLWRGPLRGQSVDMWPVTMRGVFTLWTILMLPMLLTLESALVAALEHNGDQWKNVMALPAARWNFYVAKLCVVASMLFASTVLLGFGIAFAGKIVPVLRPEVKFAAAVPWQSIATMVLKVAGLTFLALAIQHWISLRWRSFTVAMGAGIVAMVISFVVINSEKWGRIYPWSLPTRVLAPGAIDLAPILLLALGGGIVAAALGCWDFCRRDLS